MIARLIAAAALLAAALIPTCTKPDSWFFRVQVGILSALRAASPPTPPADTNPHKSVFMWAGFTPAAAAEQFHVVTTIKPIHSLAAAIMEGAGAPTLLVDGTASPHTFALKPSAARAILDAAVFIRTSPAIEPFTARIVETLPAPVTLVTLADTPGLTLLDRRTSPTFEPHDHGHDDHLDHDDDGHVDHDHIEVKDGHIWLDPRNAALMADKIAAVLSTRDPAHAEVYAANTSRLKSRLAALETELASELAPLKSRPFIVFHDATQYFEARFGLSALGSITVSPEVQPSAKRLTALRGKIASLNAVCVFTEPYFNENLLHAVTEGSAVKSAPLDPEALALAPGPELYFTLMRALAAALASCLAP